MCCTILVQFGPIGLFGLFGPFRSIGSILVHLFQIGPVWCIRCVLSNLVHSFYSVVWSNLVPCSPIWSNSLHFGHFNPFGAIKNLKRQVWVESVILKPKRSKNQKRFQFLVFTSWTIGFPYLYRTKLRSSSRLNQLVWSNL